MKSVSQHELSQDVARHLEQARTEPLRVVGGSEDMVIVSLATLEARALLAAADAIERGEGRPAREVFDELYASAKD